MNRNLNSTFKDLIQEKIIKKSKWKVQTSLVYRLNHIYSMVFNNHGLLASAGSDGLMTLYTQQMFDNPPPIPEREIDYLYEIQEEWMTCQTIHSRWISEIQFITDQLLLSVSDDGTISLSKIDKNDYGYLSLNQIFNKLIHEKGIYTVNEKDLMVVTGSKDKSVTLSQLHPTSLIENRKYLNYHTGVVKCVRWSPFQDSNNFISAGADKIVNIYDHRIAKPVHQNIPTLSSKAIINVEWLIGG